MRIFALEHTDRTSSIRDRLVEEQDLSVAEANNVMARNDQEYLPEQVPESSFNRREVDSPNDVRNNPEVVKVVEEEVEVEDWKTALVCRDCVEDSDEVIW